MIQVEHLRKSFGENVVLADVSITLRPGERAALVGRNGTGKSTILRVLAGRLEADSGQPAWTLGDLWSLELCVAGIQSGGCFVSWPARRSG